MARITLENRHPRDERRYTLSPITIEQLYNFLGKAMKISLTIANEPVVIADDEEGNGFHHLYTIEWTHELVLIPAGEELDDL